MINMIKERMNDNGMKIINKKPTRNGRILDHIYTNKPEKIINLSQEDNTTSDHSLLEINRSMKIDTIEETIINTRNYKIINYDNINENIINNEEYENMLNSEDPDFINENLVRIINEELN